MFLGITLYWVKRNKNKFGTSDNNRTPARAGDKVVGAMPSLATSGRLVLFKQG